MTICNFCSLDKSYPCHNTRDMEDTSNEICREELRKLGGGERSNFILNFYPIVAFTGFFGVGKTEAIKAIPEYTCFSFADPLKSMLAALGLTEEQLYGNKKHIPSPLLSNMTPRFAMETLGTKWARETMHEDFWVNLWVEQITPYIDTGIINDDCRFPNEFDAIKSLGGILIRIERPGCEASDLPTDQAQLALVPDKTVINNGTIEDLHRKVRDAARKHD